jgi:hypothetical protein
MSTIRFRPISAECASSRETLVQTGRDLSVPIAGQKAPLGGANTSNNLWQTGHPSGQIS